MSFDEIVRWCAAGWSVCASTPEELEEAKSPQLLPPKHSFSVVRAIELRGHREGGQGGDRLLLLRNPWGDVEMKGELRTPVLLYSLARLLPLSLPTALTTLTTPTTPTTPTIPTPTTLYTPTTPTSPTTSILPLRRAVVGRF